MAEVAHARAVLDDWRAGLYQEAMEREIGLPAEARCPQCQQYDWQPLRGVWSGLLVFVMIFSGMLFFHPK
jgi:hypothetical protein